MNESADKKTTVLVIDDEIQIRRLLRVCLERNGYNAVEAATGEEGIAQTIRHQPELILLDLKLPDTDGLTVLKRIREWTQIPILVVSVRNREEEKIAALDSGANDFITKPFGTGELLARLRVVQRYAQTQTQPEVFTTGNLRVDLVARSVQVKGRTVKLTSTEYTLLHHFVQHAGKVLTHGHLLREIWGIAESEKTGPLRVYMGYLREKLEADPARPQLLVTEPGVGYRLVLQEQEAL
jgi:two-component system KDP operon response regulator KdpE